MKIPVELIKLHKEVFLTCGLFVNNIPLFLMLSSRINFIPINHLAKRTVPNIFKDFNKVYLYYLHRVFRITTVHVDGEFDPLKILIESLPGGPILNLDAANEHVPGF